MSDHRLWQALTGASEADQAKQLLLEGFVWPSRLDRLSSLTEPGLLITLSLTPTFVAHNSGNRVG